MRFLEKELIQRLIVSYLLKNIYFSHMAGGSKYEKNLGNAADLYRIILQKISPNYMLRWVYVGSIIGEKGDLNLVKEAFNIVHSSSNDSIPALIMAVVTVLRVL